MGPSLDDAALAQPFARVAVDSQFRQDFIRIRSQSWRAGSYPRRRARELGRRPCDRRRLAVFLLDLLEHIALKSVRASRSLGVSSHLGACDSFFGALVDGLFDGAHRAPLGEHRVALFAIAHAARHRREVITICKIVASRHPGQHLPVRIEQHPRHHEPVAALGRCWPGPRTEIRCPIA